jgi:hypothetical protein
MGLNAAALRLLAEKGLTAADIVELAEALEVRKDPGAAERMRRHRAKKAGERNGVTRNVTANTPLNDNISNPPVEPDEANASSPPLHIRVLEAWNEMAAANGLRTSRKLNQTRLKHLAARVKQHGEEGVFDAIRAVALSDWHCGRKAGSDWKANLGWLLESPEKFDRLLEIGDEAKSVPAKPAANIDQAAYLASLAAGDKPWLNSTPRAEPARNNGPPRPIGQLVAGIAGSVQH